MKSAGDEAEARIVDSWHRNASPWIAAIREGQIESRRTVTDAAIIDAILSRSPGSVLDIGCGEGWLVRALGARKIRSFGIDAVPALIDAAREAGGDFCVMSYEDLCGGQLGVVVDLAVCNFSLIGKAAAEQVINVGPVLLSTRGSLIIQTLHPCAVSAGFPYADGWRPGSWTGFSSAFTDPAPWYFRTIETWVTLFAGSGFRLLEIREPLHPGTGLPASIIFVAEKSG